MASGSPELRPGELTRQLALISVGYVCLHGCMAGVRLAAPLLALRNGQGEAAAGVLMAMFALMQIFIALPAGRLADRLGFRRPMLLSMVAATVGAGAAAAWPVFPVLCLAALLTGGAAGCGSIALQRHVGRISQTPAQMRQAFSWMSIGPACANFVGPFAAGLVIDSAGYRASFLLMAVLAAATWLAIGGLADPPPAPHTLPVKGQRAWDVLGDSAFRRLMVVNWVHSTAWDVHAFMVPVLGHERGISASAIGTILGAFAIATALVRLALPLVASRVREHTMVCGVFICNAVLFGIYPLLPSALAMGACSMLLGITIGAVQPMIMSLLHQITPEHRHGDAVAVRVIVMNISAVAMPLALGAAGALVGAAGVFWATSALSLGGIRAALGMRLRADRTSE